MPRPEPPAQGFTLVEVIVALLVFGLSFAVLAQIVQTGSRQSASAEEVATATLLARSQLARIGVELPVATGELAGEANGYRWQVRVRAAELDQDQDELATALSLAPHLIEVTVAWGPADRQRDLTLTTLRVGAVDQ